MGLVGSVPAFSVQVFAVSAKGLKPVFGPGVFGHSKTEQFGNPAYG